MNPTFSHERLLELVEYDPETGIFTNRITRANRAKAGDVCGTNAGNGYTASNILGWHVRNHRLAWFYVYGKWPIDLIDHIDGDRANNRISNLREANRTENQCNRRIDQRSKTGVKGVFLCGKSKKYKAQITLGRKKFHVGTFRTVEEAEVAMKEARAKIHSEFCRHK
jgi:HNH endonuclease/AP2 domain